MSVQQEKFTEIADAIREKTGSTDLIKPSEFASKVGEVYEAGQQSEYDRFWDEYQDNGNRKSYRAAFGACFTSNNFKPKYPIVPKRQYDYDDPASLMFCYTNRDNAYKPIDLSNYPIDLSHLYDVYTGTVTTVFDNAYVENIFIDLSNVTVISKLFSYANSEYKPRNICIKITELTTKITDMFFYMGTVEKNKLTISFEEGSVLATSLRLNEMRFTTPQCIRNIFGVMSDAVTGQVLTLRTDAIINAFGGVDSVEWQELVVTKPNWTISLV